MSYLQIFFLDEFLISPSTRTVNYLPYAVRLLKVLNNTVFSLYSNSFWLGLLAEYVGTVSIVIICVKLVELNL